MKEPPCGCLHGGSFINTIDPDEVGARKYLAAHTKD